MRKQCLTPPAVCNRSEEGRPCWCSPTMKVDQYGGSVAHKFLGDVTWMAQTSECFKVVVVVVVVDVDTHYDCDISICVCIQILLLDM